MTYQIRRQSAPFTIFATLTRRDSAERAAQIVANARHIWTSARGGGYAGHSFCKAPVDKQPYHYSSILTDRARQEVRSGRKTNAQAADEVRAFNTYQRDAGRNAGRVLAVARELFARIQPGARLVVESTSQGRIVYSVGADGEQHHVFRLTSFIRAGVCRARVGRCYDTATANPGQPQLSGGWGVLVDRGDGERHGVHTWKDAHAVSAFPVPADEQRADW